MISTRQLQYLVALDDAKHFGRAAQAVHVTQPTLSQQLKELEARLGVQLAERGRPVRLTPAGRDIVVRARRVIMEIAEIEAVALRNRDGFAGTIRLGVTPTLGPYLMPAAIVRLHRDHPDMRLYIREGIPDDQFAELRSGALDMMLAPLPVPGSDLYVEPLFREPLHLLGAPDHRLSGIASLTKTDFAREPVLSLDRRHHYHRQAADICADLGAEIMRDYEGTSLDSLRQMAGSGLGLAILPELYLRSETGGEDMVRRFEPEGWTVHRSIAAVWREGAAFHDTFATIAQTVATQAAELLR